MAVLTGAVTLSVGTAVVAGAQRSSSAIFAVSHAVRLLAIALPVAAAGGYWWHATAQSSDRSQLTPPVNSSTALIAPKRAVPAAPEAEVEVENRAVPLASAPLPPERSAPSMGEASKPDKEIRQEVALLSRAQAALSRGRPQEALEALAEHAARFPRGVLTEERVATRARTLCALGRRQEAEAELKRIEKLNPASAYLARARESCGAR
jgi:tetratricopeptide (TPR) repeat protein